MLQFLAFERRKRRIANAKAKRLQVAVISDNGEFETKCPTKKASSDQLMEDAEN